ncbi:MAG: hypothetical protein E6J29_05055 [Chloroflexi bacterium]|nr:MAG: hypothetical protein E6J29_05055 [Chloroflexota bacterium]
MPGHLRRLRRAGRGRPPRPGPAPGQPAADRLRARDARGRPLPRQPRRRPGRRGRGPGGGRAGPKQDDDEERLEALGRTTGLAAVGLGLSISLDELAIGASLGLLRLPVLPALLLIGAQALLASQLGLRVGSRLGGRGRERTEKAAGVILLALAAGLLLLHLR